MSAVSATNIKYGESKPSHRDVLFMPVGNNLAFRGERWLEMPVILMGSSESSVGVTYTWKCWHGIIYIWSALRLFLAALAALYLTLVSGSVTGCHFRILTQRVTFETWDPSDIWLEWWVEKVETFSNFFSCPSSSMPTFDIYWWLWI